MQKTPEHVAIALDAVDGDDIDADHEKRRRTARTVLLAALDSGVRHLTLCLETPAHTLDSPAAARLTAALRLDIDACQRRGLTVHIAERSGRSDLVTVTQRLAFEVRAGTLRLDDVTPELVQKYLSSAAAPDPDLIILCGRKDGGESLPHRLSGCLLFEAAYAEFHFCAATATDFTAADWQRALADFSQRDRRFGRAPEPEKPAARFAPTSETAAALP